MTIEIEEIRKAGRRNRSQYKKAVTHAFTDFVDLSFVSNLESFDSLKLEGLQMEIAAWLLILNNKLKSNTLSDEDFLPIFELVSQLTEVREIIEVLIGTTKVADIAVAGKRFGLKAQSSFETEVK